MTTAIFLSSIWMFSAELHTDLETQAEAEVEDLWTDEGARQLSDSWRGKTVFAILRPPAPPGYKYVAGRLTKVQQTSRPDHLWPEIWSQIGKKQKARDIAKLKAVQPKLKAARDKRGIWEVPADDKGYLKMLSEVRAKLSVPAAPAMPLFSSASASLQSSGRPDANQSRRKKSTPGSSC